MQSAYKPLRPTRHPIRTQDENTVAVIRAQTALFKGATYGPAGREAYDGIMANVPAPEGVRYEAGTVGGIHGLWCLPSETRPGVSVLFLHGGGYVMGSAQAYGKFAGHFARHMQAAVFVADYRLGPEHPFPAALEDAYAAYTGLVQAGAQALVVVGDSAGGGLSLALLAHLPHGASPNVPRPAAAVVMSPWTDLGMGGDSITSKADEELYLSPSMLRACASMYLGETPATHPQASVLDGSF